MQRILFLFLIIWIIPVDILKANQLQLVKNEKSDTIKHQTSGIIKIMTVGNSLTDASEPGYRGFLYYQLDSAGYKFDFVGSKHDGMPSNGGDPDHSGFSGYTIGPNPSKLDNEDPWKHGDILFHLDSGYQILNNNADVIILEIGINDFFNDRTGYDPTQAGAVRLDSLIAKIFRIDPKVVLLVSNLTPVNWDANFGSLYNSEVPAIVGKYKKLGRNCYLADLRNEIKWNTKTDLSSDQLHPTASGYKKMAELYFLLLSPVFDSINRDQLSENPPVKSSLQTIDFKPKWDTLRVLKNPHKGWYHHLLDNGISTYAINDEQLFRSFPGMDHIYLRLAWSYLEPNEGEYDWHRIDEIVEKYVPLGYKIAFRITSKETGSFPGSVGQELDGVQYATPVWVMKAGANGVVSESWNTKSWTPDWDDPVYLEKLDNFQKAFAAKYDGQPWVSYIDIGSIGEWGEGHTSFSTKIPPTVAEVKANINIYLKHFKKSQLVSTDDLLYYGKMEKEVEELFDFAVANGLALRDDSPMVDWYLDNYISSWSVSHPHFFDPLYLEKPVIFELQHFGEVKSDGNWIGKNGSEKLQKYGFSGADILRNAVKTMHATYLGYHDHVEDWLPDNPDLTNELANICGYWFFPVNARFSSKIDKGKNEITIDWLNKGVAPAYHNFDLVFRFESDVPENSFETAPVGSGNKKWLPGIVKSENYYPEVPATVKTGNYILKIKLIEQTESGNIPIQIGVKEAIIDNSNFIILGKVNI
jgi:hypothetical protein